MSRENVEIVRTAYEAWNRDDLSTLRVAFHPGAEIRPFLGAVLSASTYRGHDGLARWLDEAKEPWDDLSVELTELIDCGDRVVGLARVVGRGKESGVEVATEIAHVSAMENGQIVRFEGFPNRAEALEAVGLSE